MPFGSTAAAVLAAAAAEFGAVEGFTCGVADCGDGGSAAGIAPPAPAAARGASAGMRARECVLLAA